MNFDSNSHSISLINNQTALPPVLPPTPPPKRFRIDNDCLCDLLLNYLGPSEIRSYSAISPSLRVYVIDKFHVTLTALFNRLIEDIKKHSPLHLITIEKAKQEVLSKRDEALKSASSFSFSPLMFYSSLINTTVRELFFETLGREDRSMWKFRLSGESDVLDDIGTTSRLFKRYKKNSLFLSSLCRDTFPSFSSRVKNLTTIKEFDKAFLVLQEEAGHLRYLTPISDDRSIDFARILLSLANELGGEDKALRFVGKIEEYGFPRGPIFQFLLKFNKVELLNKIVNKLIQNKSGIYKNNIQKDYLSALIAFDKFSEAIEVGKAMCFKEKAFDDIAKALVAKGESILRVTEVYESDPESLVSALVCLENEGIQGVIAYLKGAFSPQNGPNRLEFFHPILNILISRKRLEEALELLNIFGSKDDNAVHERYIEIVYSLSWEGKEEEADLLIEDQLFEEKITPLELEYSGYYYQQALFSIEQGRLEEAMLLLPKIPSGSAGKPIWKIIVCNSVAIEFFKRGEIENAIQCFYRSAEYSLVNGLFNRFEPRTFQAIAGIARSLMKEAEKKNETTTFKVVRFLETCSFFDLPDHADYENIDTKIYREVFSFLVRAGKIKSILAIFKGQSDKKLKYIPNLVPHAALAIAEQQSGEAAIDWVEKIDPRFVGVKKSEVYHDLAIFLAEQGTDSSLLDAEKAFDRIEEERIIHPGMCLINKALIAIGDAKAKTMQKEDLLVFIQNKVALKKHTSFNYATPSYKDVEEYVLSSLAIRFALQGKADLADFFAKALSEEKASILQRKILQFAAYWKETPIECPSCLDVLIT